MNRVHRYIIFFTIACMFLYAALTMEASAGTNVVTDVVANQLIVLFDPTNASSPTPDQIIDSVNAASGKSKDASSIPAQLGNPTAARLLLGPVSPEFASALATQPLSSRALLQDYVLLTYSTPAGLSAAQTSLASDSRVLSTESNASAMTLSATPSDRFYLPGFGPPPAGDYQWGMEAMYMPQAWDLAWGHAYVAAIDTGIPCSDHSCVATSHPDLIQNFRPQFSQGFSAGTADGYFNDQAGHGTHVAGIISATPEYPPYFSNNQSNTGVAGVCWTCSFAMVQFAVGRGDSTANSLVWVADHGMQAVNMSWGANSQFAGCGQSPPTLYLSRCQALAYAAERDVAMVGSSGNGYANFVQWPARQATVIAVGGAEYGGHFWRDGYGYDNGPYNCTPGVAGPECGSNYGPEQQIVAPAMDIISTITLENNPFVHCGDSFGPAGLDGYGDCTGTSMAAPHITGLVGLLRSVDPLLNKDQIKSLLVSHTTPCTGVDSSKCGNGIPNAYTATQAAFGSPNAVNRLTPLFSFYSSVAQDHFYTTSPQMALAALSSGGLLPQPMSGTTVNAVRYDSIGADVPQYTEFPTPECTFSPCISYDTPQAFVSVFSSQVSPLDGSVLAPLHRYSFACTGPVGTFCASHPFSVSHAYANNLLENWIAQGYKYDGIEGYIYPPTITQPAGTIKLCRANDPTRHDWMLFPGAGTNGSDCSATTDGFTGGNYTGSHASLGWIYSVRAPQAVCANGAVCGPDLTVTKSHSGNFVRGQIGALYSIVVKNSGNAASSGTVSVVDLLPAGLTATNVSGTGWTCTLANLTCNRSNSLAAGATYPTITVTVNVAANAPASIVNTASVSGGSDAVTSNNTTSDVTGIVDSPDLAISAVGSTKTATVKNMGWATTFTNVSINVVFLSNSDGAGIVMTWPSSCIKVTPAGIPAPGLVASFTCSVSSLAPQASSSFVFSSTASIGANGSMSVSLVTPTTPADTNGANDTAAASVTYPGPGS